MERSADWLFPEDPDAYLDERIGRLLGSNQTELMLDLFKVLRGQIDRRR
jgi:hypothetical protein